MSRKQQSKKKRRASTLAALLEEKPKRGRPPRQVKRQNVYVALTVAQKALMKDLAQKLPAGLRRADVPDLAITILATRMEALRQAVSDRDREIPEGITDLESLYLLWDLALPSQLPEQKWTSLRVSPQQVIEMGRVHGALQAVFGSNRSQVFGLGLMLLKQFLGQFPLDDGAMSLAEVRQKIRSNYL